MVLTAVGIVWIKSLVPPESPSGSLQFLSAAPELPIFDKAGKKTDLAKAEGQDLHRPLLGDVVPALRRGDPGPLPLLGQVPHARAT